MDYYISLLIQIVLYTLIASSYNLVLGFAGQFHAGQVAFLAIGGYAYALLSTTFIPNPIIATIIAGLITTVSGFALGKLTIKLKGPYLVIGSFAFAEIVRLTALNWVDLTNGSRGIFGLERIFGLNNNLHFLILISLICALSLILMYKIVNSQYGLLLEAVREDDIAVESIGKNSVKTKLEIFCVSAFFAGIGGALLTQYLRVITPEGFGLTDTLYILLMVLLGGKGSFKGTIIGVILIISLSEVFRFIPLASSQIASLRVILYALCFILIMLYRPQGICERKKFTKK